MNSNQLGQVPVPRGFRSPKGHEASSTTKVCGADDELVVVEVGDVVDVVMKDELVVDMDDEEDGVVDDVLEDPVVEA